MGIDTKILDRVRAYLAKAESTEFTAEAETFTAAAQALMTRYRIDSALLEAAAPDAQKTSKPNTRCLTLNNPYMLAKSFLLQVIAEANGCKAVYSKREAQSMIIGFAGDIDIVEILYTSLTMQAATAMHQQFRSDKSFRSSFLYGYAHRIGERLQEETQKVIAKETNTNLLPVLYNRAQLVRSELNKQFPKLKHNRPTVNSSGGYYSGQDAANRANLHNRQSLPS